MLRRMVSLMDKACWYFVIVVYLYSNMARS